MYVKCGVCRTSLSIGNSASGNIGNFTKHVTSSQHDEKLKKGMSPASTNKEKEKENLQKDNVRLTEAQALEKASLSIKNGKLFCRPCKFTFKLVDSPHVISHLKGKVHSSNKTKFGGTADVNTFLKKTDEQSA